VNLLNSEFGPPWSTERVPKHSQRNLVSKKKKKKTKNKKKKTKNQKTKNEKLGRGTGDWRDCSSKGPEFKSQHSHGASQPSVMKSDTLFWGV
jgi:hypothetical protein